MSDLLVQRHQDGLGKAELRNFNLHVLAAAPSSNLSIGRYYYDSILKRMGIYNGTGFDYLGSGTMTSATITQPSAGIQVSNSGIAQTTTASWTISLSDDLAAVEGLSGTGLAVRTAANTWAARSITGTTDQITVTNGDGVAGNPVLSLPQNINTAADVTFNSLVINEAQTSATPSNHAASVGLLLNLVQGMRWKDSVRAASTGNLVLSGIQTVDTVNLVAGNRVLAKDQTNAPDNGIYVVSSGAWARASDADAWAELVSATLMVEEGTQADTNWTCTANSGGTLGSTSIAWTQVGGGSGVTAGNGLSLTGNTLDVNVDGSTIEISSDSLRVKTITDAQVAAANKDGLAETASMRTLGTGAQQASPGNHGHDSVYMKKPITGMFGNGADLSFSITHNLGTLRPDVRVTLTSAPYTEVLVDVQPTSINDVTLTVLTAPASNAYTYSIKE